MRLPRALHQVEYDGTLYPATVIEPKIAGHVQVQYDQDGSVEDIAFAAAAHRLSRPSARSVGGSARARGGVGDRRAGDAVGH